MNRFNKALKKLQEKEKLSLRKTDEDPVFNDFINIALDCCIEDINDKIKKENTTSNTSSDLNLLIKKAKKLKKQLMDSNLPALRAKIEELSSTNMILADYLRSAILLYDYSLAVPEYTLAIEPAANMLAANLVSLGILDAKNEQQFSDQLKSELQAIPPDTMDLKIAIQSKVSALCSAESYNIKQKDVQKACDLILRTFAERDRHAKYGNEIYSSTLPELLHYALQQYRDFHPIIEPHREKDLIKLQVIVDKHKNNPNDLDSEIKKYLSSMQRTTFGSHLKTLCTRALDYYQANKDKQNTVSRTLRIKDYTPPDNPTPSTHVLAIHGLEDSLKTWDVMAQQWLGQGFAVHTYDQAGHGLDAHRQGKGKPTLDPTLMHFDLYQKIDKLLDDPTVKVLHVYAHSFGGGLVANSLHTINQRSQQKEKEIEIHLITPAAMKTNIFGLLTKMGDDISPEARGLRGIAPSRQGAVNLINLIGRFIRFMSRSLDNLRHYTQKQDSVPIRIHEAEKDMKVNKIELDLPEVTRHQFFKYPAGHNLHQEPEYAEKIVKAHKK